MLDHRWVTSMDERSENIGEIYDMVAQIARERTTAESIALVDQADILVMPARWLKDLPQDPHLAATGLFQKINHPTGVRG